MKPDPADLPAVWETVEDEQAQTESLRSTPGESAAAEPSVLDAIVDQSDGVGPRRDDQLRAFLDARSVGDALAAWLGREIDPAAERDRDKERLLRKLSADVAQIDGLLNEQLNAVLHHPRLQRLEASWRGIAYLIDSVPEDEETKIKVKVLNISWRELERDIERAAEFDQSEMFRKIYEHEFGTSGGEPFGMMIADYEIHPTPTAEHRHDDIEVMRALSEIGAASFCPMIANASPAMLGLDEFTGLERTMDHSRTLEQKTFLRWKKLRESEDAKFAALALPHVLMRLPYKDDGSRVDRFVFSEDVAGPDAKRYLWGGAAFALAGVVIRAFADCGWLADIRGVRRGEEGGGLITGLPVHCFTTDRIGVAPKSSTDVVVREALEKELSDEGFLPICQCPDTEYSAFYSSQSIQEPKTYDRPAATRNARISSMLPYMLCASRFAHYLKVLGRDFVGGSRDPEIIQRFLHNWVHEYVTPDTEASADTKARLPLREAQIRVASEPGKPGSFRCTMHLSPHYQLDEMVASVRLVTMLAAASNP